MSRLGSRLNSNENLDQIAKVLDDVFRVPGTNIRFGLDALVGWIPGIGDAFSGIASCLIIFAAWQRGSKSVTLFRMLANVVLETLLGSVPIAGDFFHVAWKANRRNYKLLLREQQTPGRNGKRDWLFLIFLVLAALCAIALPVALLIWFLRTYTYRVN